MANLTVPHRTVELPDDDAAVSYALSLNVHRRHLKREERRELIAELLKATPEKSDRQIAETVKAGPTTVGSVRAEMEAKGDVSKLDTRKDSTGRTQPARKPKTPNVEPIDAEAAAASGGAQPAKSGWSRERWKRHRAKKKHRHKQSEPKPADDIGTDSMSEAERLRVRNEELENEKRRLEIENTGLRSEIKELKAEREPTSETGCCSICREKRRTVLRRVFICDRCAEIHELEHVEAAPPADDGLDIPQYLRRAAS